MNNLINKLVKTKHVNSVLFNLCQLHFGTFDIAIYTPTSYKEVKAMNMSKLYNKLRTQIFSLNSLEEFGIPK